MHRVLFRGPEFSVVERDVSVRGKHHRFVRIVERDSSVILPFLDDGRIVFERQYRHAIGRWVYELPAGHIEKGESAVAAAARELKEETGYSAHEMKFLFKTYELPDLTSAVRRYYVAHGLVRGRQRMDPTETIKLVPLTMQKVLEMIDDNIIDDPCAVVGILYYCRKLSKT